jgi:hypothetical protein
MIRAAVFRGATVALGLLFATGAAAQSDDAPLLGILMKGLPPVGGQVPKSWDGGLGVQAYSMVGREDRIAGLPSATRSPCVAAEGDAVAAIAARAKDAQFVMINEAHESPRDRAFIADVAKALAGLGYATFAGETLIAPVPNPPGPYPLRDSGFYANEPSYGALLRSLRDLGYTNIAYEYEPPPPRAGSHFTMQMEARESGQASNLINQTVRDRPNLKVLVHVGFSHNRETVHRADGRELRWLALRFKEITGIDPLTIDQTTFVSDRTAVCAMRSDGSALPTDRDVYVAHPPLAFERGRPTWRLARGQRFAEIPQALKRPDERVIYEARTANEPDDAVPADRLLVDPGEDMPLLLAPGRYRVRAWTEAGAWTASVPLAVADPTVREPQKARPRYSRRMKR